MNEKDFKEFYHIREATFKAIHEELMEDNFCKSYEGTFELTICWPDYFEDDTATAEPEYYKLTLHCYVLGPARHYDWCGRTLADALKLCKSDLIDWGVKL